MMEWIKSLKSKVMDIKSRVIPDESDSGDLPLKVFYNFYQKDGKFVEE